MKWKTIVNNRNELEFKKEGLGTIIRAEKEREQFNKYYQWTLTINKQYVTDFKTKSQALRYARAYMKKH